jgi:hypothetical protein
MLRADESGGPTLEEGVAHGICDEAVNASFVTSGRIGVAVCVHRTETKVTFAMPSDATATEAAAAYEVAREQSEFARRSIPQPKRRRKRGQA